jgi:hypothetical protein
MVESGSGSVVGKGKGREIEGGKPPPAMSAGGGGGYANFLRQKQHTATPIPVPQNPKAVLFVKGFYEDSSEEDVRKVFSRYGPMCVLPSLSLISERY